MGLMVYMQHPGAIEELSSRVQSTVGTPNPRVSGFHRASSLPGNVKMGGWREGNAGGCKNHPSWITNPQYIVTFPSAGEATISITQLPESAPPVTMGAYIFDATHMHGYRLGNQNQEFAAKLSFINLTTVSGVLTVEDPTRPFMIMPCTFEPNVHREFKIEVSCPNGNPNVKEAREWHDGTLSGEWITGRAGGSMNYRSWSNNQTFRLSVGGAGPCTLVFAMFVPEPIDKIGFYIFEDVNNNGNPVIQGLRGNCPFRATYSNLFKFEDMKPGNYIILPCTDKPKNNSTFYVAALSARCTLTGPYAKAR